MTILGCNSLTSVTIPKGVSISMYAFYQCEGLTSVTCSSSIDGERAFSECTNLNRVNLLDGVETIGQYVFTDCKALTTVSIPSSMRNINSSFKNCTGLTIVNIEDLTAWCAIKFDYKESNPLYYAHHLFMNGEEIKDLVIPEGVSAINSEAFNGCEGLTSISIPATVTNIGIEAFAGCISLEEVYSEIKEPFSVKASTFSSETYTKPLYVPNGTKAKYEATSGWKNFKNIVEMDNTDISGVKLGHETYDVYTLQGHKVRHEATSLDGLPKGVYIINGRKIVK